MHLLDVLLVDQVALVAAQKALAPQAVLGVLQRAAAGHSSPLGVIGQFVALHLNVADLPQQQPLGAGRQHHHDALGCSAPARRGAVQLDAQRPILGRLDDVVQRIHLIALDRKLGHVGHKDQDDLPVDLPQAVGRLHAVDARQLNVHEHDVIVGTVMFQKRCRIPEGRGLQRDIPLCRVAGKAFFQMFQLSGAVLHDRTAQHPVLPFTKTFRNQYSAICENWQQLPLHTINIHQPSW